MIATMPPRPQQRRRRWRRFLREYRGVFFIVALMVVVLVGVGLLFWLLSSSRFVKSN